MRRAKLLVLQHPRLVERLAAQHFMPELFIQATWLGRLVLERLQIHHARQWRRPAARLIPLVAMQRDGVRFQQAGKETGRERDAPRRDDDRPDVVQRQPPLLLPIRPAGDESAFTAQNRAVLEDVKNVVAHRFNLLNAFKPSLHPNIQRRDDSCVISQGQFSNHVFRNNRPKRQLTRL